MSTTLADLSARIHASAILVVDDNEINRIFIQKILSSVGFTNLLLVPSGEDALRELDRFCPDIIILDILMPGMDGFECCERIRAQPDYGDLPILIQTSLTEAESRVMAFAKGATDFVSKPLYPEELCARVRVHLEKRHSLKILQLYKNRVESELENARQLQHAILPGKQEIEDLHRRCRLDISSYFRPSSEIGGDFWGAKNLFPHQAAIWLVDFSGHGIAAALNAFRLQAYLKEYSLLAARPGEYLSHMNDKLLPLLLSGQFATMFYGIIDVQSNLLFYACACVPHPIILRGATGKAEMIDGTGIPLGIGMHMYHTQSVNFVPGDMIVLYSDALTESPDAAGNYISEQHIMELLEKNRGACVEDIKTILLDYFHEHTGGILKDDLTIAIFARSAEHKRGRR